jgi:hypothetical protein
MGSDFHSPEHVQHPIRPVAGVTHILEASVVFRLVGNDKPAKIKNGNLK